VLHPLQKVGHKINKLKVWIGVNLLTFSQFVHCSEKLKLPVSALTLDFAGLHIWTHCSMKSL
jgi:hypothetical protein